MAKTAQSGNIYSLKSTTLDAIRAANKAGAKAVYDEDRVSLSDITQSVVDEAKKVDSAIEFRNRVNEINNRDGAQLTDDHKASMQTYLQTLKADNIDALISGDKAAQEEAMKILNNASNATTGWGIAIDEIKNVTQGTDGSGGVGFSNAMDSKTADILGKIASGESTMKIDEEGKVTFDVVVGGETLNITKNQLDGLIKENVKPVGFINESAELMNTLMSAAETGGKAPALDARVALHRDRLNQPGAPSVAQLFKDPMLPGNTKNIMTLMQEDPALSTWSFPVSEKSTLDKNNDGVFTIADLQDLDYETMVAVFNTAEYEDVGKDIVANVLGNYDVQQFSSYDPDAIADIQPMQPRRGSAAKALPPTQTQTLLPEQTPGSDLDQRNVIIEKPGIGERIGSFVRRTIGNLRGSIKNERDIRQEKRKIASSVEVDGKTLKDTVYEGDNIQELKRRFERKARSTGMSEVDINKLFQGDGPAIITQLPNGKYTVRLRTAADANLPRKTPDGKAGSYQERAINRINSGK